MGQRVVRKDHPHNQGESGQTGSRLADLRRGEDAGRVARIAQHVGDGEHVLILGREASALELSGPLEALGCRTVHRNVADIDVDVKGESLTVDDRYDAVILADLLGRIDDPRALLRALKDRIRPGGTLLVAMGGITPLGDWLALIDDEPLGARSGVLFTEEGLLDLLEESGYLIGHVDPPGAFGGAHVDAPGPTAPPPEHDYLIVAHPLPIPGLDFLQSRMRDLMQQNRDALREAEALRRQAAQAEQRLEILAGQERRMAERIKDLRTRLLDAHAEMIRRDDEIRKTFGDAIFLRNALLIERDALLNQRDALSQSLHAVGQRLDRFRRSPLGLAYRVLRKLSTRRGPRCGT